MIAVCVRATMRYKMWIPLGTVRRWCANQDVDSCRASSMLTALNWSWDLSFHVEKLCRVWCRRTCEQYLEVASWPVRRWRPFVQLAPVVHLKLQRPQSDFFVEDVEATLCQFCFLNTDLHTLAGCELRTNQTASSASKERGRLLERNCDSSFRVSPGIQNQ